MNSGGGDRPPSLYPPGNGGEFLLQLLRKPAHQPPTPPLQQTPTPSQNLSHDPAVAAVGPALNFPPIQSSGHDLPYQYSHSPPFAPHNFFRGFPPNPNPNPNSGWIPSSPPLTSGFQNTGVSGSNPGPDLANHRGQSLMFGSVPYGFRSNKSVMDGDTLNSFISGAKTTGLSPKESKIGEGNRRVNGFEADFRNSPNSSRNLRGDIRPGLAIVEESRVGEGSRRLNGLEADFRNSPNSSRNLRGDIRPGLAIVEESRVGEGSRRLNGLEADFRNSPNSTRNVRGDIRAGLAMAEVRQPPPGFQKTPSNRNSGHNVDRKKNGYNGLRDSGREKRVLPDYKKNHADMIAERRLSNQLDCPGPPAGTDLHSVSAFEIEESMSELHGEIGDNEDKHGRRLRDDIMRVGGLVKIQGDLDEQYMDSLEQEDGSSDKNHKKQSSCDKDYRSDTRGQRGLSQRIRNFRRQIECRGDLDDLCAPLVAIYESLIPPEEEKMKQKQLLALLEKLVTKEWPEARLFVYGSCANSFGVVKSDIDICLTMEDPDVNKSEVLLKLADILQSDNLENVQALTRARVPIVKFMDPVTGISCDICLNNVLAVVNSKLLRDYAKIDVRLQQLAFIVKHWAKTRGVNETYRGTLSSYAYVLMCIHFLQQRIPAILPCLQGMDTTYAVTVDNIECAYFHQVEKLSGFGSRNRESIAQLVWAFFHYWAYCHDYAHDVVSVRTGRILSKRDKDWTRRVGNDRHLICIEDPFEISHDLGRVVDKNSIKVLKEEFIRAAEILQCDPNPCVRLFEPYIPS